MIVVRALDGTDNDSAEEVFTPKEKKLVSDCIVFGVLDSHD